MSRTSFFLIKPSRYAGQAVITKPSGTATTHATSRQYHPTFERFAVGGGVRRLRRVDWSDERSTGPTAATVADTPIAAAPAAATPAGAVLAVEPLTGSGARRRGGGATAAAPAAAAPPARGG